MNRPAVPKRDNYVINDVLPLSTSSAKWTEKTLLRGSLGWRWVGWSKNGFKWAQVSKRITSQGQTFHKSQRMEVKEDNSFSKSEKRWILGTADKYTKISLRKNYGWTDLTYCLVTQLVHEEKPVMHHDFTKGCKISIIFLRICCQAKN